MGCWASARTVGGASITDLAAGLMLVTTPCRTDGADAATRRPELALCSLKFVTTSDRNWYVKGLTESAKLGAEFANSVGLQIR